MRFILIILMLLLATISKSQISVLGRVDHIEPDGIDTTGNIALTVSGSTAPYTYTWSPGTYTTQTISNQAAGQYTLNVRSASSQTYTAIYKLGYKVEWTNLNRATFRNDTLASTLTTGSSIGNAISRNTLSPNTNGWFEFVITDLYSANKDYYIGFTDSISNFPNSTNDIDFGIYAWGQEKVIYSKEGAVKTLISGSPKIGDVVRVEKISDTIFYKINNIQVRKKVVTGISSKTFKLKANLSNTCKIINVGCNFINFGNTEFDNYVETGAGIIHSSGPGIADGKITVKPEYAGTSTYTWTPSLKTGNTLDSLTPGQYTVTAMDSLLNKSQFTYNIGYKVGWTNLYKTTLRKDTLSSTSAIGFFGSAISKNTLEANTDGWFEFRVSEIYGTSRDYYIGFTDSVGPDPENKEYMDYGIRYWGQVKYMYSIEHATETPIDYNPNINNIIRIQRVGDVITYKINGVSVRTLTVTGISQRKLKIRANLGYTTQLMNVGASFNKIDSISFANYVKAIPLIKHSSGLGINDGSIKLRPAIAFANTYSWSPGGSTTSSISALAAGTYTALVKDSLINSSTYKYNIGYKVKWTNFNQLLYRNDSLISSAISSRFSKACSKNILKNNENGWFEMVLDQDTYDFYTGFSDSLSFNTYSGSWKDIDYGFFFNGNTNLLSTYENGTLNNIYKNCNIGDVLRVERNANTISYKVNGVQLRSISASGISAREFKLKIHLEYVGKINNIGCSFYKTDSSEVKNYVEIFPLIKHSSGTGINDGSVSIRPRLSGLQSYSWQPSGITTATNSSLFNGATIVTVTDSSANKSSYSYNIGYKTKWADLFSGFFRNDTLKATAASNGYNYARTLNVLPANENGWFEYIVPNISSPRNYIGLADSAANSASIFTDIQFGVYSLGTSLYFYEGGTNDIVYGYIRPGDVIRIERVGNTINYKLNSEIIRTVTNGSIGAKVFRLKAKLGYQNYLTHIGCSFTTRVIPSITHVSCIGSNDGSILAGIINGPSSLSYTWQPGGAATNSIVAIGIGTYSLTYPGLGGTSTNTFSIGYKTRWGNLSNTTVSNDTLKQTRSDFTNTWSNGATSLNTLPGSQNGWVEYIPFSPLKGRIFGLLDTVISAESYSDIDYGIYLSNLGILSTVNNGVLTPLDTYIPGDVIRIQRSGDTISYKKNGITIWTNSVSPALLQKEWKVKATIFEYGATLASLGCSFSSFDIKEITVQDVNCISGQNGTATFNSAGGTTPYSFNWDGGSLTSADTYTNLSVGVHTLQAIDNNSCTATQTFTVMRCPNWTTVTGGITVNSKGDVVKSSGTDSWDDNLMATADTFRLADTAFWVSFNTVDTASVYMIGFRSLEEDTLTQVSNYKLFVENSSITLIETDNDGFYNKREIAKINSQKDLKIQLSAEGIEYYVGFTGSSNYELIYTSRLYSNRPFIIENQLYKTGSKLNRIRVSGNGN